MEELRVRDEELDAGSMRRGVKVGVSVSLLVEGGGSECGMVYIDRNVENCNGNLGNSAVEFEGRMEGLEKEEEVVQMSAGE